MAGSPAVPLAVHIVREVLRGLHYAHTFPGLGLVHRDVSPSNILIDWAGAVRLAKRLYRPLLTFAVALPADAAIEGVVTTGAGVPEVPDVPGLEALVARLRRVLAIGYPGLRVARRRPGPDDQLLAVDHLCQQR